MRSTMTLSESPDWQQMSLQKIWINLFAALSILLISCGSSDGYGHIYLLNKGRQLCTGDHNNWICKASFLCIAPAETKMIYSTSHILHQREKVSHLIAIRLQLSRYYNFIQGHVYWTTFWTSSSVSSKCNIHLDPVPVNQTLPKGLTFCFKLDEEYLNNIYFNKWFAYK